MENNKIMSKILVCLYIIIALLTVNTLVLIIANADSSNSTEGEEVNNQDYDVSMFKEISIDDLEDIKNTSDSQVIYIGRSTCGYCVAFLPVLQQAQKEYGYTTKYLDISTITTEDQKNKILELDNDDKFLSTNFGSTPMVLIIKDGKLVDGLVGYNEYDSFVSFLEENGITK